MNLVIALEKSNASDLVQDFKKLKHLITRIAKFVEPEELKYHLSVEIIFWINAEKGYLTHFMCRESALVVEV